jgi:hypothetical protein
MGKSSFKWPNPISSASMNVGSGNSDGGADVTIGTLIQFLLGSRPAILALASRRDTFWLGLALIISAGFVREYNRSNLILNPWLVGLPFVATVGLSLVLFPVVEIVARQRGAAGRHYWARYRVFLSLLWMTAPLAWVFIMPVELLMSPDHAAIINLWLLGILVVWRMLLISRILGVLFVPHANEIMFTGTFLAVMLVTDTLYLCNFRGDRLVMMVGSDTATPITAFIVIQFMSVVSIAGVITWPVWFVGTLAVALWEGPRWSWTVKTLPSHRPVSSSVKFLAAASVLIWAVVLPMTQPRLQRIQDREQALQDQPVQETASRVSPRNSPR